MQLSILWQIPQYVFMQMGEVLVGISGLQFVYTQAPKSLKSVATAYWFINNSMGNLLVAVISELNPFIEQQTINFFFYAFLMFTAILIFAKMSSNYQLIKDTPNDGCVNEI